MDFEKLLNRRVSILLHGKDGKAETYIGIITEIDDDSLILTMNNPKHILESIFIRKDIIESIWVYKK